MKKTRYSLDFKTQVLQACKADTTAGVAKRFGINPNNIYNWKHRFGNPKLTEEADLQRKVMEQEIEINKLRKQLLQVLVSQAGLDK
jgi:transposase-like protein